MESRSKVKSHGRRRYGRRKQGKLRSNPKTTVSLALNSSIVRELRMDAADHQISFNARVNEILQKYVEYYKMIELNGAAIIHPVTHQFFIDEIDESNYTDHLKKLGIDIVRSLLIQNGIPLTFDTFVAFMCEKLALKGGAIRSVKRFVDENDGRTCLYFVHDYDMKWSRILSAAFAYQIEILLHYHTSIETFSKGFQIKITEQNPV